MRTTLTLENDIAERLQTEMRESGRSFKETVNSLLRLGLEAASRPQPPKPFRVEARPLGARPGLNFDNISGLLDELEGPDHR